MQEHERTQGCESNGLEFPLSLFLSTAGNGKRNCANGNYGMILKLWIPWLCEPYANTLKEVQKILTFFRQSESCDLPFKLAVSFCPEITDAL